MDSRIIYESAKTYIRKVTWTKPLNSEDTEWEYIGTADNIENITKIIQEFFLTDQLYVAQSKHESFETNKEFIADKIKPLIGKSDFSIWDLSFQKVIEFNQIGVCRRGNNTSR